MFNLTPWKKTTATNREPVPYQANPLAELRNEFNTLFNQFLSNWADPFGTEFGLSRSWGLDVEDGAQEVVVKAEVPGFEPGELDVQVSGNVLTVKAEKQEEKKGKKGNGQFEAQRYRSFHRSVTLPPGTNPDQIQARYRNGLLEVHVPKSEEAKGKRIPIKA